MRDVNEFGLNLASSGMLLSVFSGILRMWADGNYYDAKTLLGRAVRWTFVSSAVCVLVGSLIMIWAHE